jgi:hypothetical protein
MPELEITEFKNKPHGDFGGSFHGTWFLACYHYEMQEEDCDDEMVDRSQRWYAQLVVSQLQPNNVWKTLWWFCTPFVTEKRAMEIRAKLRMGDVLWWGLDQELRLRRSNGETVAITCPWKPVQVAAVWDCGRVSWAVRDENGELHLLDSDLREVHCLNLQDADLEEQTLRFRWAHSSGGVTFFVGKLYSADYSSQDNKFSAWRDESIVLESVHLRFPEDTDYLALVFDADAKFTWTWDSNSASFVRSKYSRFLARKPIDFNQDFAYKYTENVVEIHGLPETTITQLPLDGYHEAFEGVFLDQFEPGTLWVADDERLFRFRFLSATPTLLQLATHAYASACLDLIGCDFWKSLFASSIEKLTAGLNARQTIVSSPDQQNAIHTRFSRGD